MPNFFIIGAPRSGTTSLYAYLSQHPDVYMSPVKEPRYFAPKGGPRSEASNAPAITTLDAYRALFAAARDETAIGEASVAYLSTPQSPALIRESVPGAKLVATLRNPIDRAYSAYCLHRLWGDEDQTFAEAIGLELDEHDEPTERTPLGYVNRGFYGEQLTRFLECFDRDRLRVYLFDDLVRDPSTLLRDLFEHLEVDPTFVANTTERHNASRYEPKHQTLDRVARRGPMKALARRLVSDKTWARAKETLRRRNSVRPDFPDDVRSRLVDVYRSDVGLTQDIVGRDLSAWLG